MNVLLLVLFGGGSLLWITTVGSARHKDGVVLTEASRWQTVIGVADLVAVVLLQSVLHFVLNCEASRFSER